MSDWNDQNESAQKLSLTRREFLRTSLVAGATAVTPSAVVGAGNFNSGDSTQGAGLFVMQWKNASPELPWLSEVTVRPFSEGVQVKTQRLSESSSEFPNGLTATLSKSTEGPGVVQIRLGGGYGFLFSDRMLEQHQYLWVREMGIYISRLGTWEATEKQRAAAATLIRQGLERPYLSCAEKYYQWTGYIEQGKEGVLPIPTKTGARTGLDDKIWDFVREKETWPAEARSVDHVNRMPEVDATYFTDRFPDLQYFHMYFGWPDHDDRFSIWNNGKVGISSNSVAGDPKKFPNIPWLPRASGYTIQFGVGTAPRFREYGDESVRQHLHNGYDLIPVTEWSDSGMKVEQTSFAYPLDGEQIKTGIEPLINWTVVRITNQKSYETDTYLGIQISDEDFFGSKPLDNFRDVSWRKKGGFFHDDNLLIATDPDLKFEEVPTTADAHEIHDSDMDKEWTHSLSPVRIRRFRAQIRIPAAETKTYSFASLYRAVPSARLADVRSQGYRTALKKTIDSWDGLQARGASVTVPDSLLNNLYRTFLPRITISAQLDINGYSILQTGPIFINRIWPHVVATAVADYLAPRGYFDLAKLYMEPFFHWQGTSAGWPAISDWNGFFGVPPVYSGVIWMMHHGVFQWGCARYYQLSGDRTWLDEKLPALLKSMDWVKSNRSSTKKLNADGSRPLDYGWLPPGQVGDADFGTAIQSDSHNWRGMHFLTDVLESIGHPRAPEFRAETQDYYECLRDSVRRATTERPIVRLNDDTWVPYIPAFLEKPPSGQMEPTLWYAEVVDGGWETMMETELFLPGSSENTWLVNYFEDSYSPMIPGGADEAPASHAREYLRRDLVGSFLYALYSQSTMRVARQTLTTYEHRSMGRDRTFELTGSAAGYWTRNFLEMLCRRVGDELWLMQATPRRWLKDGERIEVKNLQTDFGPVSFSVRSNLASNSIEARVTAPSRHPARRIKVRFRVPEAAKMRSVMVNGATWHDFEADKEWVTIPGLPTENIIQIRY